MSEKTPGALRQLHGGLVVSCQAPPGDPLHGPTFMAAMARAAVLGGAVGIRANGLSDIEAVRRAVDVPVIGLWKDGTQEVYITPTVRHAHAVVEAGAQIVAIDATTRPRPDGSTVPEVIEELRGTNCLVMADVSTLAEGVLAARSGADLVATTLSGYTPYSPQRSTPDLELVTALAARVDVPVVAEGRIGTPRQAGDALDAGAWAVVVGGAITRPQHIAERFVAALRTRADEAAAP
ncbi:MAG TPA: N-acetylmannosamine-6-phosphate 2-epimerase [Actinomycetota bacterium]|nr:N-acetylmannosamine-6-phosphate 2-epimerase [Actinomycetota bacterium]